jgi:hypothetical protein
VDSSFFNVTLGTLLGSGLVTAVFGLFALRRSKTIEAQITGHFDERLRVFESKRAWRQQALSELFGPLYMQFERTRRAFGLYTAKNLYLEAKVMREGNETARDILLTKGHLIPPSLIEQAGALIEHYDAWLEEFDRVRGDHAPASDEPFVFVGTKGHPFPSAAEAAFKAEFKRLQHELYDA